MMKCNLRWPLIGWILEAWLKPSFLDAGADLTPNLKAHMDACPHLGATM